MMYHYRRTRETYDEIEETNSELKEHIDNMYKLVNEYANEHDIKLAYDDRAEYFVEAIAKYIVESAED